MLLNNHWQICKYNINQKSKISEKIEKNQEAVKQHYNQMKLKKNIKLNDK